MFKQGFAELGVGLEIVCLILLGIKMPVSPLPTVASTWAINGLVNF